MFCIIRSFGSLALSGVLRQHHLGLVEVTVYLYDKLAAHKPCEALSYIETESRAFRTARYITSYKTLCKLIRRDIELAL